MSTGRHLVHIVVAEPLMR